MKTTYVCTKCQYRFSRDKEVSKCPYCGSDGTIERQKSAQEILDSLTDLDEQLGDTREEMKKYK
jgi:predicted ATP-dependent serine protease